MEPLVENYDTSKDSHQHPGAKEDSSSSPTSNIQELSDSPSSSTSNNQEPADSTSSPPSNDQESAEPPTKEIDAVKVNICSSKDGFALVATVNLNKVRTLNAAIPQC